MRSQRSLCDCNALYATATLADLGLERDDPRIERFADAVLEHFDGTGFETLLWLPRFLTKEDDREWGRGCSVTHQPSFVRCCRSATLTIP